MPGSDRAEATMLAGSLLLVFTYVFLANTWIGDDAYITFRVVDNFIHGYGLTFNPDERVQAYNTRAQRFPTLIVARIFGFATRPYFEAPAEAREVPKVQF